MLLKYPVSDLIPYMNNPRKNDLATEAVAKSIKEFGFKVPIVIDSENVIITGHTRLKAAQMLGLEKVPCVIADDLLPEQIKAFRLVDNKVSELADWDFEKLDEELSELNDFDLVMEDFGFDVKDSNFSARIQVLNGGGEIDTSSFDDEKFECTCPKCGFKFNR